MKLAFEDIYVPGTSVIIERTLSKLIERGAVRGRVLIPREFVYFFESMARSGSAVGLLGLEELSAIRSTSSEEMGVSIEIVDGDHKLPLQLDQRFLDHLVVDIAKRMGAKVLTHDKIQYASCRALNVDAMLIEYGDEGLLWFERYFDQETLSLHIKEGAPIMAKKGRPGEWRLVVVDENPVKRNDAELLIEEIVRKARSGEGIIENEKQGLMLIQLGDYRIVVVSPPINTAYELTITRPIARLKLEDYNLPEKLVRRLDEKAEGILVAGAPGMGKTTFAQALAEYYSRKGRIVKTVESPRDMRLPNIVSQYSKHYATSRDLHDILLLSRPDYTVFDEMRDDDDFMVYVDLRLAGIGMIGVVHATSSIDAIQRFIRRVDIGMIPSIIDTVIFIDRGRVAKVYELLLTVRLPTGLREADLARPVVEVRDFLTGELEYEIYVFGEQTVVVPVKRVQRELLSDRVTSIVKKVLPEANVSIDNGIVIIDMPKRIYSQNTVKLIRKLKRKLDKMGYDVEVRLI
ncbi:MAG: ATPase, T2SS/T4P/T4SS family [Ignisphaera sp.]|nr:ATPase, T2SS/T4P/T4SS family [Ignisphaera sp.]MCX8168024.1 ATPase, T2SS/T4P/T4SS family [Ignisphaera sp.]MDW8085505.1 ATPase, T2SS/T4P/T4SS family [Ignisphaera sp.]